MTEEERQPTEKKAEKDTSKSARGNIQPFLWMIVIAIGIFLLVRHFGAAKLWNFCLAIFMLGIIVIVHEFGHFVAAKLSGMRVDGFSLGFPPTVLGFKRTADGYRIRLLPMFFRKHRPTGQADEEDDADIETEDQSEQDGLFFTFGKPKKASETEYRINLIPFGGYVRIFGQEDIGRIKRSDDPRSYSNKPVWKRICVISAGVVFNVLLAVVLSIVVFSVGIRLVPPIVGGVVPRTPAAAAGLKGGDEIIEIAGHSYNLEFEDILMWVGLSDKGKPVDLKIRHEDGSIEDYEIVPRVFESEMGPIRQLGIMSASTLKIAKFKRQEVEERLYSETGLKPGDIITAVNGIEVDKYRQIDEIISNLYEPKVALTAERVIEEPDGSEIQEVVETEIDLTLRLLKGAGKENDLGNVYSIEPCLKVSGLMIEQEKGFEKGDIIIAAGDVEYPDYGQFRKVVEGNKAKEIVFSVIRSDSNGIFRQESVRVVPSLYIPLNKVVVGIYVMYDFVRPVVGRTVDIESPGKETKALEIPSGAMITAVNGESINNFYDFAREMKSNAGSDVTIEWRGSDGSSGEVVFGRELWADVGYVDSVLTVVIPFEQMQRLYRADGILDAVKMGCKKAVVRIIMGYTTIKQALLGQVSPKSFVGPVGIVAFGYQVAAESSMLYYLYIIALISALIGVLNAMPILPFDGGHIVFLIIEKIKGSPVNERIQFSLASAGWIFLLGLALYITFNDFQRVFGFF